MLNTQPQFHNVKLFRFAVLATAVVGLVWIFSSAILTGQNSSLLQILAVAVAAAALFIIFLDWKNGIYLFFSWLVFEDLIRKFGGNSTYMFFAKDLLLIPIYLAMLLALRRGRFPTFRPPFLLWFSLFFWWGALQVLNPNSPNILYGLLGLKTYFFYVPLMFAGYALLRSEDDLYKFLTLNAAISFVVSGLGIAQSVLGLSFLNPTDLAPELQGLGNDIRRSPISGVEIQRGTSVYVSEGRYAQALILFFILVMGTAGYFLLKRSTRGRKMIFPVLGVVLLAAIMSGVRGAFVGVLVCSIVIFAGMVWGVSNRKFRSLGVGKAIRRAVFFGTAAILLMTLFFPKVISDRWTYYSETLSPNSSKSELGLRGFEYPIQEIKNAVLQPNWELGNGIGLASLGAQYVTRITGVPLTLRLFAENGYSGLLLEMGIVGVLLWVLWTCSLALHGWTVLRQLRNTPLFPLALAILWLVVETLILGFFYGLGEYQNYISNAYLWLCVGILFRLPGLLDEEQAAAAYNENSAER